jgi:PIN domain nuclease of toxin-antitoxin system
VRVVSDSHALVWYGHNSAKLSDKARRVLDDASDSEGVVVSVMTFVELWYVTETTQGVSAEELALIRRQVTVRPTMWLHPVDEAVADAFTGADQVSRKAAMGWSAAC